MIPPPAGFRHMLFPQPLKAKWSLSLRDFYSDSDWPSANQQGVG